MEDISPTTLKNFLHNGYSTVRLCTNNNIPGVEKIAAELAIDITRYMCGTVHPPINHYAPTMRRCVEEMLIKHEYLFNGMVNKLHITSDNVALTFHNVVNELFRDGAVNWGRVVSVYAFAGRLAKHLAMQKDSCSSDVIHTVSEICGSLVAHELKDWIEKQGGWASFEAYFPEADKVEKTVWQGLLFTAALGLGALATMVAAR
jgi:hypothetical protein